MNEDFEEKEFSLTPINFFQLNLDCPYLPRGKKPHSKSYLLPDLSDLCVEKHFADVSIGWNETGIEAVVYIHQPFHSSSYPNITSGDSVELFFDTRDVKTSGFNTRFCHHFFFLPESIEGHQAGEMTRFRTEDTHELCQPSDLQVSAQLKKNSYQLNIFIPIQCLHGYDPDQFKRLGFTYRINRSHGSSQHFSVISNDYQIEQQPSLWSTLNLVK